MTDKRITDRQFTKQDRVRKRDEFARVYNSKTFAADETLVINGVPNGLERSRIGLSISRRVGNAVVRNKWKRRIREAFRIQKAGFPAGLDLVIRPRKGAECEWGKICISLISLAKRIDAKVQQSPKTSR